MANVLSRMGDILSSNINDLLDKCENPEKMARQYLRQAMEDLADVRKETAVILAEEKRCKKLYDSVKDDSIKWKNLAVKALEAANEGDAKVFLQKEMSAKEDIAAAELTYNAAKANAKKMRDMHDKLSQDVSTLQSRLKNVEAMSSVAKAQTTINKMSSKSSRNATGKFDKMEQRIADQLNTAEAESELLQEPTDEATDLADKYGTSSDSSVDSALADLKASMGL